uniref:Nuclear pore complex protein Nup98-Nup96 n=1 Tax=Elaeophora elaphi TaxID=1147741 RepID=A0A0R3RH94_9BILA
MFGKSPFGSSNTSAFGAGSSLFGSSANRPTTGFGAQTTTQSTGLFGQKSIFGSPGQSTSLFGSTQPASSASTSIFGQSKPLFGGSSTTQSASFGGTTSLFGSTQSTQQTSGVFGSSFGTSTISGTTVKFEPPTSTDTMLRNGTNQTISTKHMCITAMKQYENKSLEELRCDDYLANRKGPQSGGLVFGQASQSSSSLFGPTTTTTQSSIFGQNKPLFGSTSTGFGATTTTSSLLFGTSTTTTSIFGSKPATGGLFGSSTAASPFGQTQTSTGLFGAKPSTGFGTQSSSLFGGPAFSTATSSSSPFTFGNNTQPATSTASTGLFGAKPSTSGFGAFGASTSTASPFGAQSTGGLFGSKPAAGGLFGSNTGSLFGQAAPSSTPSLFGSSASKPTNSLFGSTAAQPVFGSAQQVAGGNVSSAAPIVLGADFNQWQIEKAVIEAQLAASPYGDNPLLKLLTTESQEKSNIPNPVSIERQIRFLASKKDAGAVTTTTPSGPLALGSIPAAASRIRPSAFKSRDSIGDFTYHSMFLPPGLRGSSRKSTSLNLDSNRSSGTNGSSSSVDPSSFLGMNNSQSSKSKHSSNVKRLDLSVLHKYMQDNRRNSTNSVNTSLLPVTQTNGNNETTDNTEVGTISRTDTRSITGELTTMERRTGVPHISSPSESLSADSTTTEGVQPANSCSPLQRTTEVSSSTVHSEEENINNSLNVTNGSGTNASSGNNSLHIVHPAGIILTRRDYECEPSLEELGEMALTNNGACHIESGFTIRRLAFGSVFWPGPFELHDVNLDKVVHFRQHEVIVYPDDDSKPPVGQELNRFAEVSLDRVWPRDKKTKEYITDPLRLEEMGYRAKLERASLKMGAKFKDYRPETGTWVFTVPHFTKYGLPVNFLTLEDDDDFLDEAQLNTAFKASRIQNAVQRAKLPKLKVAHEDDIAISMVSDVPTADNFQDRQQELKQLDALFFTRGLGGVNGYGKSFLERNAFFDTLVVHDSIRTSMMSETEHKMELCDNKAVLDDLVNDSMMIDAEEQEDGTNQPQMYLIDPVNEIISYFKEGEQVINKIAGRTGTFIDGSLMNGRCGRVSWNHGRVYWMSDLPNSLSVRCFRLQCIDQVPAEYIIDLFRIINSMSKVMNNEDAENLIFQSVSQRKPDGDFSDLISNSLFASKSNGMSHDSNVLELCDALFGSQIKADTDYTRMLNRREEVAKWLQKYLITAERHRTPSPSGPAGPAKILHLLLIGDLEAAIEEAIENNYPHLACGLSAFKHTNRAAYKNQIEHWKKTKECKFIDENLLKIYLLMAGEMQAEINGRTIFVNDGLDGLQALCTFVSYFDPFDASLKCVLHAFENDLKARKVEHSLKCNIFYKLIQLACDPSQSVEALLEPGCTAIDPMDYHLCWHLWFILRILGFEHSSESTEHALHIRYAEQLCQVELYHLAAIVLMHISDLQSRNDALIDLGDRIADKADEETYAKLSAIAGLPDCIIARYMQAKLKDDEAEMCLYALQGGMLEEAHSIFFEKVAPNMIILDDYECLGQLGDLFEEVSDRIPAWGPGGQIFTDFYHIKKRLEEIGGDEEVKEIIEWAHSLELRLVAMPVTNPVQRLAATVMSKYVLKLIYGYEGTETENLPLSYEDKLEIASDLEILPNFPTDLTVSLTSAVNCNSNGQ